MKGNYNFFIIKELFGFYIIICCFSSCSWNNYEDLSHKRNNSADNRNVLNGIEIPDEGYCDQPYLVKNFQGDWVCVLTTSMAEEEGAIGQFVASTISKDFGKNWSPLNPIESPFGRESSWAVPYINDFGRIYVFYNYNTVPANPLDTLRGDTQGAYMFRFSDDGGYTWSNRRYEVPIPTKNIDKRNAYQGEYLMFWSIDKPQRIDNGVIWGFSKVKDHFFSETNGWVLFSDNLQNERDPEKINFSFLPDIEKSIFTSPGNSSVAEEHNLIRLNNGDLYMVYRTIDGGIAETYSRDLGKTWTTPQFAKYAFNNKGIKNSRACPNITKFSNGKYVLWFHNHSEGNFWNRNPVWISGGVEVNGEIQWSQPEILLYDDNLVSRMSYPDWIEENGRYWVTQTNKYVAKIHEVDPALLEGMWNQAANNISTAVDRQYYVKQALSDTTNSIDLPQIFTKHNNQSGISIDFWLYLPQSISEDAILLNYDSQGIKIILRKSADDELVIILGDEQLLEAYTTEKIVFDLGTNNHVSLNIDFFSGIKTIFVNGSLMDGGSNKKQGWLRTEFMSMVPTNNQNSGNIINFDLANGMQLRNLRIFDRYLRTSEVIGNFKAGL